MLRPRIVELELGEVAGVDPPGRRWRSPACNRARAARAPEPRLRSRLGFASARYPRIVSGFARTGRSARLRAPRPSASPSPRGLAAAGTPQGTSSPKIWQKLKGHGFPSGPALSAWDADLLDHPAPIRLVYASKPYRVLDLPCAREHGENMRGVSRVRHLGHLCFLTIMKLGEHARKCR